MTIEFYGKETVRKLTTRHRGKKIIIRHDGNLKRRHSGENSRIIDNTSREKYSEIYKNKIDYGWIKGYLTTRQISVTIGAKDAQKS